MDSDKTLVVGVGSALIDILVHEDDAFVTRSGAVKGGMAYKDKAFIDQILAQTRNPARIVPGGSACNTILGIGQLGGRARFVGKCGVGDMAQLIRSTLENHSVEPMLVTSETPTGRVLSIITPDAQRSMLTCLGASAELSPAEMTPARFSNAAIVHIEGYLLFDRELITAVLKSAKAAGALVSLDLASYNVVEGARDILSDLVGRYVDILIANEDEALAYTGIRDERQAVAAMASQVDLAVLKIGPRGSLIAYGAEVLTVAPRVGGRAVDTTGAGDLWAAGFLFGLVNDMPLDLCGEIGSLCGYEVCQVVGANIPDERWTVIKTFVEGRWPKKN